MTGCAARMSYRGVAPRPPAPPAPPGDQTMKVKEGRRRVVIERVRPEIDCGRFPAKRTVGERVIVEADVFADGHEIVAAALRFRREEERAWEEVRMHPLANDR